MLAIGTVVRCVKEKKLNDFIHEHLGQVLIELCFFHTFIQKYIHNHNLATILEETSTSTQATLLQFSWPVKCFQNPLVFWRLVNARGTAHDFVHGQAHGFQQEADLFQNFLTKKCWVFVGVTKPK